MQDEYSKNMFTHAWTSYSKSKPRPTKNEGSIFYFKNLRYINRKKGHRTIEGRKLVRGEVGRVVQISKAAGIPYHVTRLLEPASLTYSDLKPMSI